MDFPPVTLLLLRLYVASTDVFCTLATVFSKVVAGIESAFKERHYIFLENYSVPFREDAVNVYASSGAAVDFRYNADKKEFSSGTGPRRNLPILSLEILRDDAVVFDLTDFIEGVTVYSDNGFPSICQIVQAWMIDSHVILTRECDFMARVVADDGSTHVFNVQDDGDIGESVAVPDLDVPDATGTTPEATEAVTDAADVTDATETAVTDATETAVTDTTETAIEPAVTDVTAPTDAAPVSEPLKIE